MGKKDKEGVNFHMNQAKKNTTQKNNKVAKEWCQTEKKREGFFDSVLWSHRLMIGEVNPQSLITLLVWTDT